MTRLGPDKVALFLHGQAEELTRIWRMARANARPDVFPGLLDDLVSRFFELASQHLDRAAAPEDVWLAQRGVLRWPSDFTTTTEVAEEWALLLEVLGAASEAVNAEPAVQEWLDRAVTACAHGTAALDKGGPRPRGLVTAVVFSSLSPRHPPAQRDDAA